jgi:hypothetical protein
MIEGIHWTSRDKEKVRTMGLFNNPNNDPNNRNIDPNAPNTRPGMPQLSQRNIIIIGLVVLAAIYLLPRLLNTGGTTDTTTPNNSINSDDSDRTVNYNDVLLSTGIDSGGCAANETSTVNPDDTIYLVVEGVDMVSGTTFFGRLYFNDEVVADAEEVVANQDYTDTCVNLFFESGQGFEAGSYQAQLFVNGSAADTVDFQVR